MATVQKFKLISREHLPRPLVREGMYFFLGKKSPFYPRLSEFNKVLGQMIRDGTLKKIHEKYATD